MTFLAARSVLLASSIAAVAAVTPARSSSPPDVVFLDGRFTTLDAKGTAASAVAVKDGRFVAVGSSKVTFLARHSTSSWLSAPAEA